MAVMTQSTQTSPEAQAQAQAAECAEWEHYGNGHYRPKRGFTGAEILVFEPCALTAPQSAPGGARPGVDIDWHRITG
jgi:hypothetical protein